MHRAPDVVIKKVQLGDEDRNKLAKDAENLSKVLQQLDAVLKRLPKIHEVMISTVRSKIEVLQ